MKSLLKALFSLAILLTPEVRAQGVFPSPANRIRRGSGAPSGAQCASASAVGQVYVRSDAGAAASTFYVCANTGVATYAWDLVGGSGTVSTGAAKCIAFYPSAGTNVDDTRNSGACALEFDSTANTLTGFTTAGVAMWVLDGDDGSFVSNVGTATRIDLICGSAPSTPAADHVVEYCESDKVKFKNDGGTVFQAALVLGSGTLTLGTSAISANACATVVTSSVTGVATTDVILWTPNADLNAVTGYGKASTDGLIIYVYPTTDTVNAKVCNGTGSSITPGAATLNFVTFRF